MQEELEHFVSFMSFALEKKKKQKLTESLLARPCGPPLAGQYLQTPQFTLCLGGALAEPHCPPPPPPPETAQAQCPQNLQPGIDVSFPFAHPRAHLCGNQIYGTQCISEAWGPLWGLTVQWSSLWKSAKC